MGRNELQSDKDATYNAIIRLIEAGKTQTAAFRKLTARLEWVNGEMEKKGYRGQ